MTCYYLGDHLALSSVISVVTVLDFPILIP